MDRQFFTISEYVDQVKHISATEKIIGGRTDVHVHEFFEIEFVIEGNGKHVINDSEYDISSGSIYFLTPGTFHRIVCKPKLKLVNIMFDETVLSNPILSKMLVEKPNYSILLDGEDYNEIYTLSKILINNLSCHDGYTNLFISHILNCIIIKIIRASNHIETGKIQGRHEALNDALRYLYNNFKDNPSLKSIALMFGYSPNYFSKIFTEFTGKGYVEFLNGLKVAHAKVLLTSGDKTVSEIAFYCGFSSLSNFYRVFHSETGVAPLDYRKNPFL